MYIAVSDRHKSFREEMSEINVTSARLELECVTLFLSLLSPSFSLSPFVGDEGSRSVYVEEKDSVNRL